MTAAVHLPLERALILAPRGRDALVARDILHDAHVSTIVCRDFDDLLQQLRRGADVAIITEEALRGDIRSLALFMPQQGAAVPDAAPGTEAAGTAVTASRRSATCRSHHLP